MKIQLLALATLSSFAITGCDDGGGGADNENEVITTVVLTFTPSSGAPRIATFNDPDGDGGQAPTVDPVNLTPGNYALTVQLENRLANPQVDITEEVSEEDNFHLLLFTGTAVVGPATSNTTGPLAHSYTDMDGNGLPVGLTNAIAASPGTGQLTVTLRHLPPEEPPVKAADTVSKVRTSGFDAIGGSTDAQVNFAVTVQ